MVDRYKQKEARLTPEQKEKLEQGIAEYETEAQNYHEAGDLVSAAGIYQMLSKYDSKRYGKLREKILQELDESGDTEGYAMVMGSGDKTEAKAYAKRLYDAGHKEESAYTRIAYGDLKGARKIIAELSRDAKDDEAFKVAMRLLKGKEAKQQKIAALHEAKRAQQQYRKAA